MPRSHSFPSGTVLFLSRVNLPALLQTATAGFALLAMLLAAGCSKKEQPPRVAVFPVTGQVTFAGHPAAGAWIVFHPLNATVGFPAPRAQADNQGNFSLTTYDSQDGAPAGQYAVTIELRQLVQRGEDFEPGPNLLPPQYSTPGTTKVVARVAEGPNTVPITIAR